MKRSKDLFSNEYEEIEFEDEAVNDKQEYIDKVKKIFGVDISEVFFSVCSTLSSRKVAASCSAIS